MWRAVRTVYHERDLTGLNSQALAPLAAALRRDLGAPRVLLRAHWRQGPHVDLVVDCNAARFDAEIFPQARDVIEAWLAEHPSTSVLDPDAYAAQSEVLAGFEQDTRPLLPLMANNQVVAADYDRGGVWNVEGLAGIRDEFLCDALDLVFELNALKRQAGDAFYARLAAMMACIPSFMAGEAGKGAHRSYWAHGQAYLRINPQAQPAFARMATRYGPIVARAVESVLGDAPDPFVTRWLRILGRAYQAAAPVVTANLDVVREPLGGGFGPLPDEATFVAARPDLDAEEARKLWDLLRFLTSEEVTAAFRTWEFNTFRFLVNLFYLLLPSLSVSGIQRFCLCYLVGEAMNAELDDLDPQTRVRRSDDLRGRALDPVRLSA